MYQGYVIGENIKQGILDTMYKIIGDSINQGLYSFKGGYVLSKRVANQIRRTSDIDVDIYSADTFDLVISSVSRYLDYLVSNGIIYNYKVKPPKITSTRNISGGIKLLVKPSGNLPSKVVCGIDISIHQKGEGVVLSPEGYSCFSNERMLADKVCALYGDEKQVLRRIRDVVDIFMLLKISNRNLDKTLVLDSIKLRGKVITHTTTLEKLVSKEPSLVFESIDTYIHNGERVNCFLFKVTSKEVLSLVLKFLTILRGK